MAERRHRTRVLGCPEDPIHVLAGPRQRSGPLGPPSLPPVYHPALPPRVLGPPAGVPRCLGPATRRATLPHPRGTGPWEGGVSQSRLRQPSGGGESGQYYTTGGGGTWVPLPGGEEEVPGHHCQGGRRGPVLHLGGRERSRTTPRGRMGPPV